MIIHYHSKEEKEMSKQYIKELAISSVLVGFGTGIVTFVTLAIINFIWITF